MEDYDFIVYGGMWAIGAGISEFIFHHPLNATACFLGVFLFGLIVFSIKKLKGR